MVLVAKITGPGLRGVPRGRSGPGSPDRIRTSFPDQPSPVAQPRSRCAKFGHPPAILPGGIAGPALGKPPAPVPRSLFLLFYQVEIRHQATPSITFLAPLTGRNARECIMRLGHLHDRLFANPRRPRDSLVLLTVGVFAVVLLVLPWTPTNADHGLFIILRTALDT